MTVASLIAHLMALPPDAQVFLYVDFHCSYLYSVLPPQLKDVEHDDYDYRIADARGEGTTTAVVLRPGLES